MPTDFLRVLREFQERNVRYVLVGGLAVLLHGIDRLTADIDLVVDLAPEQASKAVENLLALGFKANAPIDPRQFADPGMRRSFESGHFCREPRSSVWIGWCKRWNSLISAALSKTAAAGKSRPRRRRE